MKRFKSDKVHRIILKAQDKMFSGVPAASRGEVFSYHEDAKLPIDTGSGTWRNFKVTLVSYMVEDEDYWENVRLVGTAITNRERKVFSAPGEDRADEEGKPEDIGLVILENQTLDILPYSVELYMRAFDDSSDITKLILEEFRSAVSVGLAGATATLPFSSSAQTVGSAILKKVVKKIGDPDEVGSLQHILLEIPHRMWKREPTVNYWLGHKFAYYYNYDNGWQECYLVLFRFELKSKEQVQGTADTAISSEEERKTPEDKPFQSD
ncbi:hypothetical protein GV827_20570 [Sulfitobacter sp. JBTF-M27]|uniref:Uncharacterized protein n=1 Tax=Sulfitobacter sediminilitoris TaxID=2698830 RepID=A0A6P0CF20_9RHOB|nr:hypothetical protein [Sulfitobacter sediminilitoris]NEK24771.1 hypothetical protein [Sulfitobacter sediminilitoris]